MKIVPIFAGTGSGLHCPKILISTYASSVKFHKSSFWVLILAAGGPYWVSISQKNGSLFGPYLKAWGSLIVLGTVERWPYLTNNCNLLFYELFLQADQSGEGADSDSEDFLQNVIITVAGLRKRCAGFKPSNFNNNELSIALRAVAFLRYEL